MNALILNYLKDLNLAIPLDVSCGDFSFSSNLIRLSTVLSFISHELNSFYNFEAVITEINDESDKMSLYIDISGLLREMGCPYSVLLDGDLENRFSNEQSIVLLIRFLISELAAAKIMAVEYPDNDFLAKAKVTTSDEHNLTTIMRPALMTLGVGRPPENMSISFFFTKLENTIKEKLPTIPKYFLGKSLINKQLSETQWDKVEDIISNMNHAYNLRRQTLIKRLNVTIQSFMWSRKANKEKNKIVDISSSKRSKLEARAPVNLIDLLAAREYPYALINKTSSGISREFSACKLNKHKIGPVPDRGGRTLDMEAPPPEMPAFQKRDSNPQMPAFQKRDSNPQMSTYQKNDSNPSNQSRGGGFQHRNERGRHSGNRGNTFEKERISQNVGSQHFADQGRNFVPEFQYDERRDNFTYNNNYQYQGQSMNYDQSYYQGQNFRSDEYHYHQQQQQQFYPPSGRGRPRGSGGY